MNCEGARTMIHPYADGELDLVRNIELEHHLESCADCSRMLGNIQTIQAALKNAPLYYDPPEGLRKRVRSAVRKAGGQKRVLWLRGWRLPALAATAAALVFLLWKIGHQMLNPSSQDILAREILQSHVRSLMLNHLTDVQSNDQHTVKPWFDGKVDFSPDVRDLSDQGFLLVGGRLEYIDGRTAAALVYQRRKHVINLLIWRTAGGENLESADVQRQGYNSLAWEDNGMTFWAMSDLNQPELRQFVQLIKSSP